VTDFAESIVKLKYTPPAAGRAGTLAVADWSTPWTDDGRTGGNPEGEAETEKPMPSNFVMVRHLARLGVAPMDMGGAWSDQDFGSGGPVIVQSAGTLLSAGKDGVLYTANMAALGRTEPANLEPDQQRRTTPSSNHRRSFIPTTLARNSAPRRQTPPR
jgi:hypothetical protein